MRNENEDQQEWMPDPAVARRYGVSLMALYRWDRADIGFPPPKVINGKKYRHMPALKEFDERLRERGIATALKESA